MKHSEAAEILQIAAAFDARTVGDSDVIAWALALDGLDPERCKQAVVTHHRRSVDRIKPAHVWALARAITDGEFARTRGHSKPNARPAPALAATDDGFAAVGAVFDIRARRSAALTAGPARRRQGPLTEPEQRVLKPMPLPPAGLVSHQCICGATYLDAEPGHDSHEVVFGHRPEAAES